MGMKSTSSRYGAVAVTIHWLTVLLVLALVGTGFRASGMEDAAAKADLLRVHISIGVLILLLTGIRVIWWRLADKKPSPVAMPTWQDLSARAVHVGLYIVIFGMAASGIGMIALSGTGPMIFGAFSGSLPDFTDFAPRTPHGVGARLIVALFALHAGAALYHQFIKRDGLLGRMWYGGQS